MTRDVMPSLGTQAFSVYARALLHAQNVIVCGRTSLSARARIIGERERANLVVRTERFFRILYILEGECIAFLASGSEPTGAG